MLKLNDLLYIPYITRNLISISKFSKDNDFYFEFHSNKDFVKSKEFNMVLHERLLCESSLYYFTNFALESSRNVLSHKSHSLSLVVNNTLAANLHTICHFPNKNMGNIFTSLWHVRMGHANSRDMRIIFQVCNIHIKK